MKKKMIIVGIMLFVIMISLFGGTLAYWNWQTSESQRTEIVFTLTQGYQCAVDGGGNITSENVKLAPASCTNSNHAIKRKVISTAILEEPNIDVNMNLWIKVNKIDSGLSNSQNFKYALTTSETSCTEGVITTGNFNGASVGDQFPILSDNFTSTSADIYYLYIWLDSAETSTNTVNQAFNLSLGGICNGEITTSVEISGTPIVGSTLSTSISNADDAQTYTYQWYSSDTPTTDDGIEIAGATSPTYVIPQGMAGKYIYVKVTSSDGKIISAVNADAIQNDTGLPTVTVGSLSGTTVALSYSDSIGVTKYYFGTSNPDTTTVTWTDINSSTSGSVDKTVSNAGKYYFAAQDASGNKATSSFDLSVGTFYYYNGSAQTSTVDRCIIYSGSSSCNYSIPSAVTSSTGPNSATYHGVSTSTSNNTVTASYTSANSKYYAVYKGSWKATYTKGTGVSSIGATSNTCTNYKTTDGTTYSSTNCSVTLPTITAESGYNVLGWYNSSSTKVGDAGGSLTLSANGTFTAKAEKALYSESLLNGADPILATGMIPVTISNTGAVTTASASSEWYDYETKQWANAVLVTSASRSSYYETDGVTIKPNQTIPETNILAYFVWIPKYSYKMNGTEESISISFNSTPSGYIEHPAFDFDGEKTGIWVGKFEPSHSSLSLVSKNVLACSNENCSHADGLIIKPNVVSRRRDMVSYQFFTARSIERSGNPFGLVSSNVDTHMMKSSEWGTVAYLSHSIYGINGEVRWNNNSGYTTGCGASDTSVEWNETKSSCEIAYGGVSSGVYPQSTTGNISGIFDMNGGANEWVMAYFSGANSKFGRTSTSDYAGFSAAPASKYWDEFTTTKAETACNGGICYGHALSETSGWYNDSYGPANAARPWLSRGGSYNNVSGAGIFHFNRNYGEEDKETTFRVVAVVTS